MASATDEGVNERLAHIKQEEYEWDTPEKCYFCVKAENCEGRNSDFKEEECERDVKTEDSEESSISLELQKHEGGNRLKQDVSKESHSSVQPQFLNTRSLATQESSIELKSELEDKIDEGNMGEAEEQQSSRSVGTNFQENCGFFPSSFPQISPRCRMQHKKERRRVKKSTRGSDYFHCSSLPTAKQAQIGAINNKKQDVHNTDQEALYVYRECRIFFKNTPDSKDQKLIHRKQKPYVSSEYDKLFPCSQSLPSYKIIHAGEKPHCCSECGKRFSQKSSLQRHTRIHTGEKPYCCSECGKRFAARSAVQRHTRSHTGEKPYCCSECGKRFFDSSGLQKHTRIHTEKKPYCCSECGKHFSYSSSRNRHMRVHTGEKPFCCEECGKRFSLLSHFQTHTRIHTGEKPYSCSECDKCFSHSGSLNNHMTFHTGQKPYCCAECGKQFSLKCSLQRHTRIHTGEKPFVVLNVANNFLTVAIFRDTQILHIRQEAILLF
ncbi:zinc finger protein 3-like [Polypterus senegalus]|uniref:zinc finger protein 3-like n=1 Tax=Polypterus senegalus TaxID=55291 RepID=UPI001962F124|nr:zinc finger protein 3-like [Polypterus senegalus]